MLLAQQIAGVYLANRSGGRLPRWLTEGAARATAAKLAPRDPRVKTWNEALPPAVARLSAPDDFMKGKLPPEVEAVLAYGFAKALLRKPGRFLQVVESLAAGASMDEALQRAYRATSEQLATAWYHRVR